ncbi:MAG TPA: hypothetical protein P5205_21075 [Candidatus Paceibacterota bacterium]|nr:hypothetical protein [Verrucomicrobiota bacterium]HSA12857.1 hypothetical protein [Candidatus Paceibacterota bacterium]
MIRALRRFIALLAVLICSLPVPADASQPTPAELDQAFTRLRTYTWSESRDPLNAIEAAMVATAADSAARQQLESRLAAVLRSGAPFPAKQYVCRKLSQIGTGESVPALAPLLLNPALSHPARFALERIPDPRAAEALRRALPQSEGKVKTGIINSLGVLRDAAAVGLLTNLLAEPDAAIAQAAVVALGHIGTVEAAHALGKVTTPGPLQAAAAQARLVAAEQLAQSGHPAEAAGIFRELYTPEQSAPVRLAAFKGLATAEPQRASDLLAHALAGDDDQERSLAARIIADGSVTGVKRFADAFQTYPPAGQIALLEAFRSRRELNAKPAALAAAESSDPRLRIAGLRALTTLADAADVPLLARRAAGQGEERNLARAALASLPGTSVNAAILSALATNSPEAGVELLEALAARGAAEACPNIAASLKDASALVRIAALKALAVLGGGGQVAAVVGLLNTAASDSERETAETTLAALASRAGAGCVDDLLKAMDEASAESRIALLRALGIAGGPKALEAVRAALDQGDARVQEAAFRVMTDWSSVDAGPELLRLARTAAEANRRVLAFRGYVRLCREADCPPETRIRLLSDALNAASDTGEKRLVIAALGELRDPEALRLLDPCFADPALAQECCLAAVKIAAEAPARKKDVIAPCLRQVLKLSASEEVRDQARTILQRLGAKPE